MDGVMNNVLTKDKFSLIKKLIEKNGFKFTKQRKLILEQFFLAEQAFECGRDISKAERKQHWSCHSI